MANPAMLHKTKGKYLWFSLLGLGFQPETLTLFAGKPHTCVKHISLGPNMFEKPNKEAFYIVTHFLLEKLNPTRFNEAYRHCWPVLSHKADAEFRKVTCSWLREILDETANTGSKVVASLLLSPGGPRFISLMLHLANYVMVQEMRTFTTDDSWVPEATVTPPSSLDIAANRLSLIKTRFLKAALAQDCFLQEYHRRAQLLVKSMRDLNLEVAKYDELLKCHSSDSAQEEVFLMEKIKKVRSLWSTIDEMLLTTTEDQNTVGSVLKGDVDQYILDGTDRVLKIPQTLLERIEKLPCQLSSGNVYEAGQLNLLCVFELTNHTLHILRAERCRASHLPKPQLSPEHLQEKCQHVARVLQNLHLLRQKICREEIPEVRNSIRELEAEWDRKWKDTLKDTPLVSFQNEDPALGFLSPMAPLSFEPAAGACYSNSVFSQYPAKLLDEKLAESKPQEEASPGLSTLESSCPSTDEGTCSPAACYAVTAQVSSRVNTSLDWIFDTPPSPPLKTPPVPPLWASDGKEMTRVHPKVTAVKSKKQILNSECENLADQFADAVTTNSPTEGRVTGLDLEGLLITLHGDPFSTRKQLPRTPESLIMDVKSSWRKAIEEDKAEKIRQTGKLNSRTGWLTHIEPCNMSQSPAVLSQSVSCSMTPGVTSHSGPSVCQQVVLPKSTLLWDTFNTELLDSPSRTGSSAVQFSLEHETLPEMSSCDSLVSLDNEKVEINSEEDGELLIPSLEIEGKQSQFTPGHLDWTEQTCDDSSFMDNKKRRSLLLGHTFSGLDTDWLMEPAAPVEVSDRVFSLDLDRLGTPSSPKMEYSLPKLITFSPVDDMKC